MNEQQFFHGSPHKFRAGDEVSPEHSHDYWPDEVGEPASEVKVHRTFFTRDLAQAARYGDGSAYRVQPAGDYHSHPYESGTLVSASPLKVLGKA
jgi:hypothetical protein